MKRFVRRICDFALCAVLLLSGLHATAAEVSSDAREPSELMDSDVLRGDVAQHIMSEFDLTEEQFSAYREKERIAIEVGPVIEKLLEDDFAGYFIEHRDDKTYAVVVAIKAGSNRKPVEFDRVDQVRHVRFSLKELRDIEKRVLDSVKSLDKRNIVQILEVVVQDNTVELSVDADSQAEGQSFVDASGVDRSAVRVVGRKGRPVQSANGGDQYNYYSSPWCSIGFGAYSENQWGFLTAGHCHRSGTSQDLGSIVSNSSGGAIGIVSQRTYPGSDYGWIHITTNTFPANPYVNRYGTSGGQPQPVYGNREQPLGAYICRSGYRTQYRCGAIFSLSSGVNYGYGWVYGLRRFGACGGKGDSGGSVISLTGEAQGLMSGISTPPAGSTDNCSIPGTSLYTPLQAALDGNPNVVLRTVESCARLTSGYRVGGTGPNVRGSISGCGYPFTVAINPANGWATMYQYGSPMYPFASVGPGGYLWMQKDGNLVAKTAAGQTVWQTNSYAPGAEARVTSNGELRVYDRQGNWVRIFCPSSGQFTNCSSGGGA